MTLRLPLILFILIFFMQGYAQNAESTSKLHLKSGMVQLNSGLRSADELQSVLFNDNYYVIVQSKQAESVAKLSENGVQIISYIPKDAYLICVPKKAIQSIFTANNIDAIHAIPPQWKLDHYLAHKNVPPYLNYPADIVKTEVVLFPHTGMDFQALKTRLGDLIISIEPSLFENSYHIALIPENIQALAAFPFIQFVGLQVEEPHDLNYEARIAVRSNTLYTDSNNGLKLFGDSIQVIMSDGGKAGNHIDLQGRIDGSHMSNQQVTVHPTNVAGNLTGAGNLNPVMRGQAWGANLYAYEGVLGLHAFPDAYVNEGVTITSVSQGGCCNTGYTQQAQLVDQNTLNHSSLINILGAGNSGLTDNNHPSGTGWGTIASHYQGAKNNITIGAVDHDDYPESYSSRGPLPDGRIKPEAVAVGTVETTMPGNSYFEVSGTSIACPNASGVMAQLYQGYKELHNGMLPHSALMKAILLNTADDLGNAGPDYIMGYGRINAQKAYRALRNETYFQGSIMNGQSSSFTIQVPAEAVGLKMMLYWHDQPGSILSSHDLVNDLDLVVTDPTGAEWLPWVLNPLNANTVAVRGEDHVNNSEQITLSAVTPGTYTIQVQAFDINTAGPQEFFVAYEIIVPQIHVIHPQGAEAFAPGTDVNIRWETEGIQPFTSTTLEYSDNNGQTWNSMGTFSNYSSQHVWSAPWVTGGQYLIRATSGAYSDTSDAPFSILKAPLNLNVESVCMEEVTISWDPTWTATGYEVFKLGEKYMEYAGNTTNTEFTFTGVNTDEENWFSVRALGPNGAQSLRAIAIKQEIGLLNCIVGLSDAEAASAYVYPNPAHTEITIRMLANTMERFSLMNSLGQEMESKSGLAEQTYVLDLSAYADGLYFLKINDMVVKIVKHH